MVEPTGRLALIARDEFPKTWDIIDEDVVGGPALLDRRVKGAMTRFFGAVMSTTEQDDLDQRVADYVGKFITLSLINAGIDYWSKQRLSAGARSEAITYKDRAEDLHRLRETLLMELREMWPIVEPLLNVINSTVITTRRSRLRVAEVTTAITPNPYDFGEKLDEAEIIPLPRRVIQ